MPAAKIKYQVIFLVGATASGKTALAINLARKLQAEIICSDSMQVYRGMDKITSAPPLSLRKKISHHLFGIISPEKEYNVSCFYRDALKKIKALSARGKRALFVGGTGLYLSILLDGIFQAKAENKALRRRLFRQAQKSGSSFLHKKLSKVDPQAAKKIHPHDAKRIIRALEVFALTGKAISEWQKIRHGLIDLYSLRVFCLNVPREELYARINARVEKMFQHGVVREVKILLKSKLGKTAAYAIGIREIKDYLDGKCDLAFAKDLIKRNTRRYAKRQLTWFRRDLRIQWIDVGAKKSPEAIARKIIKALEA
ncbi:MAG: tRNA (adenosine(37)-N6)-dimethylallyltransferase MiaA [Candidatus Omnitrophota bacterium]